jgi:hypothetical protein
MPAAPLRTEIGGESGGHCDCCGQTSKTIWGSVLSAEQTVAVYYVQWTVASPQHYPNIDLILGEWSDGTAGADRALVALQYQPKIGGGSVRVIDAKGRPPEHSDICGTGLARDDVIGTPLAQNIFAVVDAIWLGDDRIAEMRLLDDDA